MNLVQDYGYNLLGGASCPALASCIDYGDDDEISFTHILGVFNFFLKIFRARTWRRAVL